MNEEIKEKVTRYRDRLREEMHLSLPRAKRQLRYPSPRPFLEKERGGVTVLFGGLTESHEIVLKGVLEGLGYRADYIPTPDNHSLALGREYCNRGQCNPTYYTVGNLIKYLEGLRQKGVEAIEDKYVFITIGSCGPCRLGMYEEEYRKALRAAGFEGFRVIMISQSGDLEKEIEEGAGLKKDRVFYFGITKGVMAADLVNTLRHRIKPYEMIPGATEGAAREALKRIYEAFRDRRPVWRAMREVRSLFDAVETDYTRLKPKVKIIGEFWAQTTEGDGSYRLPGWLEEEGFEVMVEPVSVMVHYIIWWWTEYLKDRLRTGIDFKRKRYLFSGYLKLKVVEFLFLYHYNLYRLALGFATPPLPSQRKMAKAVAGYFSTRITGGEGHMEIAKNIIAHRERKAHLVISVKPFGCMPSTQCDGVQVKVMSDYKDGLFIPIETSGDGEVNVKSRIQMKLHEAREKAREEFDQLLKTVGLSWEEFKKRGADVKRSGSALLRLPDKTTSTAGRFALFLISGKAG